MAIDKHVDNDLISRSNLENDTVAAAMLNREILLSPSHVGTVKTCSTPIGHDSFAALLPIVRARAFNSLRSTSAPKPDMSVAEPDISVAKPDMSVAKPVTPVTPAPKSTTSTAKPVTPVLNPVMITPEDTPPITKGQIGVTQSAHKAIQTTQPVMFDRVLGFEKWTTMHASEVEHPALELSPTAKHVSRVQERESYRFNWRSRAANNESKVASQPTIGPKGYSEDKMRKVEACLDEIRVLTAAHDVSQASTSLLTRDVASHINEASNVASYTAPRYGINSVPSRGSNGSNSVFNDDSASNGSFDSLVTYRMQPQSTEDVPGLPVSSDNSAPIVRLTQDVYNSLSTACQVASRERDHSQQKIARLENRIKDLEGTGRNGAIKEDFHNRADDLQHEVTKLARTESDEVQKLRVLVETHKSQKSIMNAEIRDKDRRIHEMESDIDAMQILLVNAHENGNEVCAAYRQKENDIRKMEQDIQDMKTRENDEKRDQDQKGDRRIKGLVKEILKRDEEIDDLKTSLVAAQASSTLGQYMATAERDALLKTQKQTNEHVTRVKKLTETLAQREKLYANQTQKVEDQTQKAESLVQKVESLNVANADLSKELKKLQKNSLSQQIIDDSKEKLMKKTTEEASRLQNELRDMHKRLDASQAAITRASNDGKSLRGAAHLVSPSANTKLETTTFSCIDCYVKNLSCDSGTTCRNCVASDSKCSRWRCSLVHVLKGCPLDRPCQLVHGNDGWLMTKEPRPQW